MCIRDSFNLLPVLPLDGGAALRALLSLFGSPRRATRITAVVGAATGLFVGVGMWIYGYPLAALFVFFYVSNNLRGLRQVNAASNS